jgi:hypothetical protein
MPSVSVLKRVGDRFKVLLGMLDDLGPHSPCANEGSSRFQRLRVEFVRAGFIATKPQWVRITVASIALPL